MKSARSVPSRSSQDVPSANTVEDDSPPASSFWNLAFAFALASIFILHSRLFDVVANGWKIPRIVLSLMVVFFLLSGRPLTFLRSTTGKFLLALIAWVLVTVLTSIWRGGSIQSYYLLLQSALIFVVAASLPLVVRDVERIMTTLALAGLTAALLSIPFGFNHLARLSLTEGSYYDANLYALSLASVIPFFWALTAASSSYVTKIFGWLSVGVILLTVARAGSRGTMLGFVIMVVLLFLISSVKTKATIIVSTTMGLLIAFATMPEYIKTRYLTFFEIDSKTAEKIDTPELSDLEHLHGDTASAEERKRLLLASIAITFEHPLFGVGPGNFPTAVYEENNAVGKHSEWLVTHNSYTEISSETGLPGLILFLGVIVTSFGSLVSVFRRAREMGDKPDANAYAMAKYLMLSMTSLCVGVFFLAVGYDCVIYLWAGMAVSLRRAFDTQGVMSQEAAERPQVFTAQNPVLASAFSKVRNAMPGTKAPMIEGKSVRFNRFR
jgi:O-antigen ligase